MHKFYLFLILNSFFFSCSHSDDVMVGSFDVATKKFDMNGDKTLILSSFRSKLNDQSARIGALEILGGGDESQGSYLLGAKIIHSAKGIGYFGVELQKNAHGNYVMSNSNSITHACTGAPCTDCVLTLTDFGKLNCSCERCDTCELGQGKCNHTLSTTSE